MIKESGNRTLKEFETPYQVASAQHHGRYFGYEADDVALKLYEEAKKSSSLNGKVDSEMFRKQFDKFAVAEVGDRGWEEAVNAYEFYNTTILDDLTGLVGAQKACVEMRAAQLRLLLQIAPIRKRVMYMSNVITNYVDQYL